ncbi:hypothetical protein ACHAWO_005837 [Cyclotella atomus]|uniref:CLASP N-terminal domain-containing protein n=1 Tax=Cyclotella atomus TaxID=382360 RepID=A0ABD3Q6V7_9STRA
MDPHDLAAGLLNRSTPPSSILASLQSSKSWLNFLLHDDRLDEFELRNAFLSHLLSPPPNSINNNESLSILAKLIHLHSHHASSFKQWNMPPLFGREFVIQSSSTINQYGLPTSRELILSLLNPRPRNEQCDLEIREMILLPLSTSHPVDLCELLMESVVENVLQIQGEEEEEVSMKRETGALTKLQDYREIIEIVAKKCVEYLRLDDNSESRIDGERMVASFGKLYSIAPFALESQLETLLEEDAMVILECFVKIEGEMEKVDEVVSNEKEEGLSPLYAGLTQGPLRLTGGQLEVALEEIAEKLSITEAEQWDERLAALVDLERILASRLDGDDRFVFIDKVRRMSLPDQFADLRSQVTHAACRILICTSFEYRDFIEEDASLVSCVQQFIENCLPALMKLCTSGTRLMANQGVACLQSLCATSTGHPKLIHILCEEIVDKKSKNNNRRKGAVMGLTAALRVWDEHCFKNVDSIIHAVKEANSNKDPGVREEGRKAYWALTSCEKTRVKAGELYGERSREYRTLVKCREEVDAEWVEGGRMFGLLNTGVLAEEGKGKDGAVNTRPSTAPPRATTNKRPAAGSKDKAGTAKAGRFSTPAKVASEVAGSDSKRPSSAKVPIQTPGSKRATFAPSSTAKTLASQTPSIKSARKSMGTANGRQTDSTMKVKQMPKTPDVDQFTIRPESASSIFDEKENAPATPVNQSSSKVGTPIVSLLARPSPLSIEKCRSRNALKQVVTMLSDTDNQSEQYLGIQVLALFAKDHSDHESWDSMFDVVLELLLGLSKNAQTAQDSRNNLLFARSPSKNLGPAFESQHLYLQGIRSLLQYVPGRFEDKHIKEVMDCLLESINAPFEIVHTCERALQNLVTCTNPEKCFDCLLTYIANTQVDLESEANPPVLLSALRTMRVLIEFIPLPKLRQVTPDLLQLFHDTIRHKSVDMRKATVFVLVEMYCVLGQELNVDGFSDGQKRLIDVYVERHPKKRDAMVE